MKKKILVFLCVVALLFSGCIDQKTFKNETTKNGTVKNGDKISIDYIGRVEGGKVFDTSNESVAKQNDIYVQTRKYGPISFTVGTGKVMKGLDEGVIGMNIGETKTLTIPADKGYGQIDPRKINVIPILQSIPANTSLSRIMEIPANTFASSFGSNHSVGDIVQVPDTNINLTVKSIGTNISLMFNLHVGDKISQKGAPWNQTVISIDDKNITIKPDLKQNDIVQFPNVVWNSTVIGLNNTEITLRHNAIPDKEIKNQLGSTMIHFNETSITIDQNNKLAGKTLIFDVTLLSIGKNNSTK